MSERETKQGILDALKDFGAKSLSHASIGLFESLGYRSQKRFVLKPNTPENFVTTWAKDRPLNPEHALLADWQTVDFLFQITDDEVRAAAEGNQQFLFESKGKWNGAAMESYLFCSVTLAKPHYTRTELSGITRAVNRLFLMPAMLLFRHGDTLTLAVINRRLHKRDESKDVLEKVTLIKDIRLVQPHRAHIEILCDLSFDSLRERHDFSNFVTLHAAWQKSLDSSELNKRFFLEVANWYFWALKYAEFPKDAPKQDGKDHISVIRLITRLMFVWFIKEKRLVPDDLFDERKLPQILNGFSPAKIGDKESVFYRAILQNLFFATLNTEMDKRGWTKEEQNFMAHSLYRFRESFQKPGDALDHFKNIPFLNGGLFECLDKDLGENAKPRYVRIDGFSRREDSQPVVPDFLFFGPEREVDLSEDYGDAKFKRVKVRGLIHTLNHYKFTVAENTPIEEEIALDPELSGKVFENLLAAYNPETGATARKQTGSFYTPREIVNYMVDEALIACLKTKLETAIPSAKDVETRLRHLFAYNNEPHKFTPPEVDALIAGIDSIKSLDPAVGSGAFPMGILHKLVFILVKLDPRNEKWKERQIARVRDAMTAAEKIEDATVRERAVRELEQQITGINEAFEHNELDYGRKLYLIENCIYGVDIQPIAVQIAKMRFFISLIVDQKINDSQPNRGVRPLPNLETKFVAANTLIGIHRPGQQLLRNRVIDAKEAELRRVRERHFLARTPKQKAKCREDDARLRTEIAELLKGDGWDSTIAGKLATWNPYDQNAWAGFFDPEWMFGITDGFDIVIGNPPYITYHGRRRAPISERELDYFRNNYKCAFEKKKDGKYNSAMFFIETFVELCVPAGVSCCITDISFYEHFYQGVKKFLLETTRVLNVVNGLSSFENVASGQLIILTLKSKVFGDGLDDFVRFKNAGINSETVHVRQRDWYQPANKFQFFVPNDDLNGLFSKLEDQHKSLEFYFPHKLIRTGESVGVKEDGFVTDKVVTNSEVQIYEYLEGGKSVSERYSVPNPTRYFRFDVQLLNKRNEAYRKDAERNKQKNPKVLGIGDKLAFDNPKILIRQSSDHLCCTYTEKPYVFNRSYYSISNSNSSGKSVTNLLYVLALLNSRLFTFHARKKRVIRMEHGKQPQIRLEDLKSLPVKMVEPKDQKPFIEKAGKALQVKKNDVTADTSKIEQEIDQLVYGLYGLTPEEIKIVEDATV